MEQATHTAINWLGYEQLRGLLHSVGIECHPDESENDLREAVRANVDDGTIGEAEVQ